jgi:hypothetical protein
MEKQLKRNCDYECLAQEDRQRFRSLGHGAELQRQHAPDQESVLKNDRAELLK